MKITAAWLALMLPGALAARVKPEVARSPLLKEQRVVRAVRVENPVAIDGILSEKVWQGKSAGELIMSEPVDGGVPTEKTDVWVAFDDANLYVAARLWDSEPAAVKKLLGRRDDVVDSDWFTFAVDPYFDRRTGYLFAVNPAGSIEDSVLSNDISEDDSWDGVWESKARVDADGWTVEMRIPFDQLRFPKQDEYVWGVDFLRVIKRKQERCRFVWIPREDIASVSRFARLEGIRDIRPGRHLEVVPYAVSQARFRPAEAGNPFERGHAYLGNVGFDLKAGLKSNLTLDATVNPDFGQVEVDPAVINLSAYETYYEEKRPFFIEGASLFNGFGRGGLFLGANINWPDPTFFYSRRIGRSPQGVPAHEGYLRTPDRSSILGAVKLTGNLGGGWNFGFLNALTAREYADVDALGSRFRDEVEPFSYYGAFRAQKDVDEGRSGYGVIATGVARNLKDEGLRSILNKNAMTFALDGWKTLDKKRGWVVSGWLGGTRVAGSREDILRLQTSSMHYYQRPDASHVEVDPSATSLSGWGARLNLVKQQGRFMMLAQLGALSPGFDPNDAGFQHNRSDVINYSFLSTYQWTKPGKVFRRFDVTAGPFGTYDFQGNNLWDGALVWVQGQFANYWDLFSMVAYNPDGLSNTLTRGGPLAVAPGGLQFDLNLTTDSRKAVVLGWSSSLYQRRATGWYLQTSLELRWKPRSNFSLSVGPGYNRNISDIQWVTRVEDPLMAATYGTRYVFGHIDQKELTSEVRLNWIFNPRLSLQLYLQPFIAVGAYDRFKELAKPKSLEYDTYGDGPSSITRKGGEYTVDPDGPGPAAAFSFGDPDFNMKSLRGTLVLRWEYRPGSLIYLVWTQNRADFANPGDFRMGRDLGDLFRAPGDNIFLIKVSYRWDM